MGICDLLHWGVLWRDSCGLRSFFHSKKHIFILYVMLKEKYCSSFYIDQFINLEKKIRKCHVVLSYTWLWTLFFTLLTICDYFYISVLDINLFLKCLWNDWTRRLGSCRYLGLIRLRRDVDRTQARRRCWSHKTLTGMTYLERRQIQIIIQL